MLEPEKRVPLTTRDRLPSLDRPALATAVAAVRGLVARSTMAFSTASSAPGSSLPDGNLR